MTTEAGPNIITSGLVLNVDPGNAPRNASTAISTNFIDNGAFFNGVGSSQESGSNPTNTIVLLSNPGDSPYVLRQNGNNTEYQLNLTTQLLPSTQYVMSGWYAKSSDYNSTDTMFHARAHSSSGSHIATGTGTGTLMYSKVVNDLTWEYRYLSLTTPSDYNNDFAWYVGYGANNTTGFRYYTNLKVEQGSYPSLFDTSGTKNNFRLVNDPSFSSNNGGYISFDGANDYGITNAAVLPSANASPLTLEAVAMTTTASGWQTVLGTHNSFTQIGFNGTRFYAGRNAGNGNVFLNVATIVANTWYHMAMTYDGTTASAYLNGVFQTSGSIGSNNNTNGVSLLATYTSASPTERLTGRIGIAKVYNRVLSSAEIAQNFNAIRGRYGI